MLARAVSQTPAPLSGARLLSTADPDHIPTDAEQNTYGRRGKELELAQQGEELFGRDPIFPPEGAGTVNNPIPALPRFRPHRTSPARSIRATRANSSGPCSVGS